MFGLGIHLGLQGYGASSVVFMMACSGLVTAVLAWLGFWGTRMLGSDVESELGMGFLRMFVNGGTMFAVLGFTMGVLVIGVKGLMVEFTALHWAGNMELVLANMSIGQAIDYMTQMLLLYVVLIILIAIIQVWCVFIIWRIIQSSESLAQFALWLHFLVGVICSLLLSFCLYALFLPSYSTPLDYSSCFELVIFAGLLLGVQFFSIMRVGALSQNAWFSSFVLCSACCTTPAEAALDIEDKNEDDEEDDEYPLFRKNHEDVLEPKKPFDALTMTLHVLSNLLILAASLLFTVIHLIRVVGLNYGSFALANTYVSSLPVAAYSAHEFSTNASYTFLLNEFKLLDQKLAGYALLALLILINVLLAGAVVIAFVLKPFHVEREKQE